MENNNVISILLVILGLIFILFPMFSITLVSIFVGFGVLIGGIGLLIIGLQNKNELNVLPSISIVLGIIGIIFGLVFIFGYNAVSFITGIQFYVLGFLLIIIGICGFIYDLKNISSISSLIMVVFGFVSLLLGAFAFNHPEILAIFIGLLLILQGIRIFLLE